MFTGIIEELGTLKRVTRRGPTLRLEVQAQRVLEDTKVGDSIAVNGTCLTVTDLMAVGFGADVMPATFQRTNLSLIGNGSTVNLERALQMQTRLGGHLVTGHIDEVGMVTRRQKEENAIRLTLSCSRKFATYTLVRGSIAVDGVSLTIVNAGQDWFEVSIIPHTRGFTTLDKAGPGTKVNLESDILARYVEKLLEHKGSSNLTMEDLMR